MRIEENINVSAENASRADSFDCDFEINIEIHRDEVCMLRTHIDCFTGTTATDFCTESDCI